LGENFLAEKFRREAFPRLVIGPTWCRETACACTVRDADTRRPGQPDARRHQGDSCVQDNGKFSAEQYRSRLFFYSRRLLAERFETEMPTRDIDQMRNGVVRKSFVL